MPFAARTDADLATVDVPEALRDGLRTAGAAHRHLFGDAAIAAALAADRLAVRPASLTYLAEIVRRGGVGYAADLEETLPAVEQSALVRAWLAAARTPASTRTPPPVGEACTNWPEPVDEACTNWPEPVDEACTNWPEPVDEACASWLEAVAKILHVRRRHRLATASRARFATPSRN
jgi:hypothetical protein